MKLFDPFQVGAMKLRNRIVMPPLCTYQVWFNDGMATDFHVAHYTARAIGGASLLIVESTGIAPEGRITDNCLGLWNDAQRDAFKPVVAAVHRQGAKIAIQLNHTGRKCLVKEMVSTIYAPSALQFSPEYRVPKEMTEKDILRVIGNFRDAARRAHEAGFDAVEIHAAHGYLVNEFMTPALNQRTDVWGEPSYFLSCVIDAVRGVLPAEKPLLVRISAESPDTYTLDELLPVLEKVKGRIDLVHVSSGGVTPTAPHAYPGYQVPYARRVKAALNLPVIAVGMLDNPELAEYVLHEGDADLVAVGRALLRNPNWPIEAAMGHQRDVMEALPVYLRRGFRLATSVKETGFVLKEGETRN